MGGGAHRGVGGSHTEDQKVGWGTGVLRHREGDRSLDRVTRLGQQGDQGYGHSDASVNKYRSFLQDTEKIRIGRQNVAVSILGNSPQADVEGTEVSGQFWRQQTCVYGRLDSL